MAIERARSIEALLAGNRKKAGVADRRGKVSGAFQRIFIYLRLLVKCQQLLMRLVQFIGDVGLGKVHIPEEFPASR
jgi:hypothetical protein